MNSNIKLSHKDVFGQDNDTYIINDQEIAELVAYRPTLRSVIFEDDQAEPVDTVEYKSWHVRREHITDGIRVRDFGKDLMVPTLPLYIPAAWLTDNAKAMLDAHLNEVDDNADDNEEGRSWEDYGLPNDLDYKIY
jgi:hypothetical protein